MSENGLNGYLYLFLPIWYKNIVNNNIYIVHSLYIYMYNIMEATYGAIVETVICIKLDGYFQEYNNICV